jgi:hypothetical protein
MNDYFVFVGLAIFIVPIAVMGLLSKRHAERQYQRRKDAGWYL